MEKSKEKTNNSEENKVEKNNDFSKMDSTTKSIMEQQASFKSTVSQNFKKKNIKSFKITWSKFFKIHWSTTLGILIGVFNWLKSSIY